MNVSLSPKLRFGAESKNASGCGRGLLHGADGPFGDREIGQLEDEAVGLLAAQLQGTRAVAGDEHLELRTLRPGKVLLGAVVGGCSARVSACATPNHPLSPTEPPAKSLPRSNLPRAKCSPPSNDFPRAVSYPGGGIRKKTVPELPTPK